MTCLLEETTKDERLRETKVRPEEMKEKTLLVELAISLVIRRFVV